MICPGCERQARTLWGPRGHRRCEECLGPRAAAEIKARARQRSELNARWRVSHSGIVLTVSCKRCDWQVVDANMAMVKLRMAEHDAERHP